MQQKNPPPISPRVFCSLYFFSGISSLKATKRQTVAMIGKKEEKSMKRNREHSTAAAEAAVSSVSIEQTKQLKIILSRRTKNYHEYEY